MDLERLVSEYVAATEHSKALSKQVADLKSLLLKEVDSDGYYDDKGHKRLSAGRYQLCLQKRQGRPFLDKDRAEALAHELGIWEHVSTPVLDEDKLAAWAYKNRKDKELSKRYEELFVTPDPTWAFMPPTESQYDDY